MPAPHTIYEVHEHQKTDLLIHLLEKDPDFENVIVVEKTRDGVHAITTALAHHGFAVDSLHGSKKPELRSRAISQLSEGIIRILVSTESTLHDHPLPKVSHLLNFEVPGLAQASLDPRDPDPPAVITFVSPKDRSRLLKLETSLGRELPRKLAEGFDYASQPKNIKQGRQGNKTQSKPLQHKKPKLKNKGPRRKTGRTRKR